MSYSFRDVWFHSRGENKCSVHSYPYLFKRRNSLMDWPSVITCRFCLSVLVAKKKLFKKSYQIWDAVKCSFPRTSWRRIKIKIFESKNDDVTLFDRAPGRMFSFHCHIAIFSLKRIFFFKSSCRVLKFDISAYKLISGSSFITGLNRKSRRVRTDNRKVNIVQRNKIL